MRNLKRALSLALASVMLLGMMVVGTSASYPDVTSENNEEAIAVMQLLKVMEGDDKGNFNPAKAVTRNEMAVIMCKLLDLNTKDYAGSCPFTDVPAWAEPYVAACYANKIVSGTSATTYSGDATVTTAQAALMVLKALGYFQYPADFGDDWMVSTVKQASKISLFDGISSNANAALTRDAVAQMALNALEADVVDTDGNGGTTIKGDGFEISTGSAKYEKVKDMKYDYMGRTSDPDKDEVQQLVEKLFGKDVTKGSENDKLGRPATKWTYKDTKTKEISVADKPDAVYAGKDFKKDVIEDLTDDGKKIVASYYNGTNITDTTAREHYTKLYKTKGISVELYDDDDKITVVILEAYVAKIGEDGIKTNDKDKVTEVTVDVYEAGYVLSNSGNAKPLTIDVEDDEDAYEVVKKYDEDDVFVLYLKSGWDASGADMDKVVLAADDVETVEGKVTAISEDGKYNGWVKIDGTKYDFANEYSQNTVGLKNEGTFYLYNGYVVHFDKEANKAADEYLFVVRTGFETNKWNSKTYFAEVVFADGTAKTIELDVTEDQFKALNVGNALDGKAKQGIYAYTYDKGDDNYELTAKGTTAGTPATLNIQKGKTTVVKDTITANSKTVYVNVTLKDGKFDKSTVYTGYKTVPSFKSTSGYVVADKSNVAEYVFLLNGTGTVSSTDLIFVADKSESKLIEDTDLGKYFTYNAVVDGKIVEIMVEAKEVSGGKYESVIKDKGPLFDSATQNSDDVYTEMTNATLNSDYKKDMNSSFGKAKDDVIKIGNKTFSYTDDVVLYVVGTDGKITTGSINRNYTADAGKSLDILYTLNDDDAVTTLYIVKNK